MSSWFIVCIERKINSTKSNPLPLPSRITLFMFRLTQENCFQRMSKESFLVDAY